MGMQTCLSSPSTCGTITPANVRLRNASAVRIVAKEERVRTELWERYRAS